MSASVRDVAFEDIDALAALLKGRRAQQAFHTAIKKGQSPLLSLTAAISASLVSAAAEENVEDPLSGLAAVDDLSGLGEDCLPGENYAQSDHDHGRRADFAHASHGASYRDDPFASRLASRFNAAHDDHDADDGARCDSATPKAGQHPASHAAGAIAHAGHEGETHEGGHGGDHGVSGQHAAAGHDAMTAKASGHAGHDDAVHAQGDGHSAHLSGHQQHAASSLQAHSQHETPQTGDHDTHIPASGGVLDDLADALPDVDGEMSGIPSHHAPAPGKTAAAPAPAEDHHASLADMDLPPAEDLSSGGHSHAVL